MIGNKNYHTIMERCIIIAGQHHVSRCIKNTSQWDQAFTKHSCLFFKFFCIGTLVTHQICTCIHVSYCTVSSQLFLCFIFPTSLFYLLFPSFPLSQGISFHPLLTYIMLIQTCYSEFACLHVRPLPFAELTITEAWDGANCAFVSFSFAGHYEN